MLNQQDARLVQKRLRSVDHVTLTHRLLRGRRMWRPAPRITLSAITLIFGAVAHLTTFYSPSYLAYAPVWATGASLAALSCLIVQIVPSRFNVAMAGAISVGASVSRSVAFIVEAIGSSFISREQFASFILAAVMWAGMALMLYTVFIEVILPWSITHGRHKRT